MPRHREAFEQILPFLGQKDLHRPQGELKGNPAEGQQTCRVLVVRLSPFRDVVFSMTHSFLAAQAQKSGAMVDFCFLPTFADRELFKEKGIPLLTGAFTFWDWREFDLILISNAYTLEMLNLIPLLSRSGVPLASQDRGDGDPLFILGGANAEASQVLLPEGNLPSLLDGVFFGEGEDQVLNLVRAVGATKGQPRQVRLEALEIPGLWVPGAKKVVKQLCKGGGAGLLTSYPVLNSPESGTARLQISYGCPYFCSFCFEGYDRKPYREVPLEEVLNGAKTLKAATGAKSVDLYSFNFNTHKDIVALLEGVHRIFWDVNFLSQRLDILDTVPGLLEAELAADKRSYTLGIEGISRRQRLFYQKGLDEPGLSRLLNRLMRSKIREIKLFYILSGHEDSSDFREFSAFIMDLAEMRRSLNPGLKILFSFGLLVRMPYTPLSYDRLFLDASHWDPLIEATKTAVEAPGFDFRLAFDPVEYRFSQILALGGTEVRSLLDKAAAAGVWFDRSLGPRSQGVLEKWLLETGWDKLHVQEKSKDQTTSLGFLETRVSRDFLWGRWQQAKAFLTGSDQTTGPQTCLGRDCLGCRACSREQLSFLGSHRISPGSQKTVLGLEALVKSKHRIVPVMAMVDIPQGWAGTRKAWLEASLGTRFLAEAPGGEDLLWKVEERLWTRELWEGRPVWGKTLVALYFKEPADWASAMAHWENSGIVYPWTFQGLPGKIHWEISLGKQWFSDAPTKFSRFLESRHLPHTLEKAQDRWEWKISSKALKKQEIFGAKARLSPGGGDLVMNLVTGPKGDLGPFLDSFSPKGIGLRADLRILTLEPGSGK